MKKAVSVLLTAALGMSLLAGCGGTDSGQGASAAGGSASDSAAADHAAGNTEAPPETAPEDMYTVTMVYVGNEQADMDLVEAEMNKILAREVGAQIDIQALGWGTYQQQLQLMLSGGEKLDLVPVFLNNANSYISSGQVIDMTDLIDQYGTNIK